MAYSTRNIITGAAAVYLSAADSLSGSAWDTTALPAPVSGTPFADTLDGAAAFKSTGFTSSGIEFAYTPTYSEVEVDQLLDAAKLFKTKMTATVKTELAEGTLENLLVVWAQGGSSLRSAAGSTTATDIAGRTVDATKDFGGSPLVTSAPAVVPADEQVLGIEAGALGVEPVERQIVFVGSSPRTATGNKKRERIYHLRRSLSVEATSHSLKRDSATTFPVTFRLLPSTVSGAEYGEIRDRLITP